MNNQTISRRLVSDDQRTLFTAKLFGFNFPMRLEPTIYDMAGRLASEYRGGYWDFYALSNNSFYMAPRSTTVFDVSCDNGFEGQLSADALGVAACLYSYSNLSFGEGVFASLCGQHYHHLRDFMMEHREAKAILRAID